MSTMMLLTIFSVFIGVACLVGGVAVMFRPSGDSAVEDRLQLLMGKGKQNAGIAEGEILAQLYRDSPKFASKAFARFGDLPKLLEQADTSLDASKFVLLTGGLMAAGFFIPMVLGLHFATMLVLPIVLGVMPFFFVTMKRKKRLATFAKQLPDALELVSRALRAGHSLAAAFHLVSTELADPIRREFSRCYDEQNLGKPLEEALDGMTERVPNLDLRFFATAVILQRSTGGDLAEILDKIGHIIRERFKIWGQVQALTGEGRLSGIVLLALPPVLFVVMFQMNPKYCAVLFEDPMGQQMLAGAIVMQFIGAVVIKKIINIKV